MKQIEDHFKIRLISHSISGISKVIQTSIRYFNGTIISTSFVPSIAIWSVFFFSLSLSETLVLLAKN